MSQKVLKNTLFAYQLPSKVPSFFSAKSESVYGVNLDFPPGVFSIMVPSCPIICPTLPLTLDPIIEYRATSRARKKRPPEGRPYRVPVENPTPVGDDRGGGRFTSGTFLFLDKRLGVFACQETSAPPCLYPSLGKIVNCRATSKAVQKRKGRPSGGHCKLRGYIIYILSKVRNICPETCLPSACLP